MSIIAFIPRNFCHFDAMFFFRRQAFALCLSLPDASHRRGARGAVRAAGLAHGDACHAGHHEGGWARTTARPAGDAVWKKGGGFRGGSVG